MRSTFLLLLAAPVAAQPLPDRAVARFAPAPGEPPLVGYACASLSPDGKCVALSDEAGRLELWDATGRRLRTLTIEGIPGPAPRWSPDSRRLLTGHPQGVAVWDVAGAEPPRVLASRLVSSAAPEIVITPDGNSVVAGWPTPVIVCWDLETGAERWRSHSGGALAVTPDGRHVARGWFGQRFDFLDPATGHPLTRIGPDLLACKPVSSDQFALSPDGRLLAAWEERGSVVLRDARTGESRGRLHTGQKWGSALAFSPDGHWLATGGADNALLIWELDTRQVICRRTGHSQSLTTIDFTPDGRRLLTASADRTAYLWDPSSPARPGADPWADLNSTNCHDAQAALWSLAHDAGGPAMLRANVRPVPSLDAAARDRLITGLDADRHAARERASRALADHGRAALPALQAARRQVRSAEAAQRLDRLIAAVPDHRTPSEVAHRRAVKAMSLAGTPAARAVLGEWASGAPGAVLTDEALAALRRLDTGKPSD